MMKKACLLLAPPLLAVLALALAAQFWLRPAVEEQARHRLTALTSVDGSPVQARVEAIAFSPFTRRLALRGLEMRLVLPQGPVTCRIGEFSLRLSLRSLLACTALRDAALPENGMMVVAEKALLLNLSALTPQSRVNAQREEVESVRMDSALLRQLADGAPTSALGLFYGMGASGIRCSFISVDIPTVNRPVYIRLREASLRDWQGRSLKEATLADMQVRIDGQDVQRLDRLNLRDILLPKEDQLRRFAQLSAAPVPDETALQALTREILAANAPLFRELRLTGLTSALPQGNVALEHFDFDWLSNTPSRYRLTLSDLTVPMAALSDGRALPGLDALRLDADISVEGREQDTILEKGAVKAAELGDLRYSLLLSGPTEGMDLRQALFSQHYGDISLHFDDHGLMARLALSLAPDQRAAAVLGDGIDNFCAGNAPENTAIAAALKTFADRPGSLDINSAKGEFHTLPEVLGALQAGNPGLLFRVAARPGEESLAQQMARIRAGLAS
ncbi:MAG: hypothetical protein LUG19_12430 [Desulfovibrio sp.]|uniref:hypothetical protein n=1 Tax=Desulfovibrio sp. TaxID=885 RepID=UPI00258277D2|nr:hypothetical protein [Desulfovibrio sp.]MCD7985036.1 hypothetical protein [Desulfovibrio sp.]